MSRKIKHKQEEDGVLPSRHDRLLLELKKFQPTYSVRRISGVGDVDRVKHLTSTPFIQELPERREKLNLKATKLPFHSLFCWFRPSSIFISWASNLHSAATENHVIYWFGLAPSVPCGLKVKIGHPLTVLPIFHSFPLRSLSHYTGVHAGESCNSDQHRCALGCSDRPLHLPDGLGLILFLVWP
jgi:hypothetical protein